MDKAKLLLRNIKSLKAKHELQLQQDEVDQELEKIISIYNICNKALNDRQRKIIELKYIKKFKGIDIAYEIDYSYMTVYRELEATKKIFNEILKNIELTQKHLNNIGGVQDE